MPSDRKLTIQFMADLAVLYDYHRCGDKPMRRYSIEYPPDRVQLIDVSGAIPEWHASGVILRARPGEAIEAVRYLRLGAVEALADDIRRYRDRVRIKAGGGGRFGLWLQSPKGLEHARSTTSWRRDSHVENMEPSSLAECVFGDTGWLEIDWLFRVSS